VLTGLLPQGDSLRSSNVQSRNDRASLVAALVSVTETDRRLETRRFLEGLSSDELLYIVDYLGARVLDPDLAPGNSRYLAAQQILRYQQVCRREEPVRSHKMILLLEFLKRTELGVAAEMIASRSAVA
jgi:hypothetical protein